MDTEGVGFATPSGIAAEHERDWNNNRRLFVCNAIQVSPALSFCII